MSQKFHVTKFRALERPQGKALSLTWEELVDVIRNPKQHECKEKMPLLNFTKFDGDYRKKENVGDVHAIVVEHDGETVTPQAASKILDVYGVKHIIYTSPSHTWDAPRWRAIVSISEAVDEVEHGRMVRVLNNLLSGAIAPESVDVERAWYYGQVEGVEYEVEEGGSLPLDQLLATTLDDTERGFEARAGGNKERRRKSDMVSDALAWVSPTAEPPTKEAEERIRNVLKASKVDPDAAYEGDHGDGPMCWRDVIMALHSTQHPQAKEIAIEWSRMSTKYDFDKRKFDELWKSFTTNRESTVTFGSLVHHAKENGWVDPWSVNDDVIDTYGDMGNGEHFAIRYRGKFLYIVASKTWVYWDDVRWKVCDNGEHVEAAKLVASDRFLAAAKAKIESGTEADNANYRQASKTINDIHRINNILSSASSIRGMSESSFSKFDSDPYLFSVRNGVVDLLNGELLEPKQSMLNSKQANCKYVDGAQCPRFLKFMDEIFLGDTEMVQFVQRTIGMSMIGKVIEEVVIFMLGSGSNGKSVLANILFAVLGDYVVTMDSSVLMRNSRSSANEAATREKARLQGVRVAMMNELESDDVFSEKTLKELGSSEAITARNLYEKSFQFMPTHTIFLRGNHLPGVRDATNGFWRRMVTLEFKRQFEPHERDTKLAERILAEERDGVFMWMLQGCLDFQEQGLKIPKSVQAIANQYRKDSDVIGEWIEECCNVGEGQSVSLQSAYVNYCDQMRAVGIHAFPKLKFKKAILERKLFDVRRATGGQTIFGLSLNHGDSWAVEEKIDDEL